MYFRNQNKTNMLTVDDDYARLVRIHPGGWEFEFLYSVSRAQALRLNALSVSVSVSSRSVTSRHQLANSHVAYRDTRRFITNILTQQSDVSSALKQQEQYVVAARKSDITAHIDNNTRAVSSSTKLTLRHVSDIRRSGEVLPVLGHLGHVSLQDMALSDLSDHDMSALMYDMIFHMGVDPSIVVDMDDRSVSAASAFDGTLRPLMGTHDAFAPSSLLLNKLIVGLGANNIPTDTDEHSDSSSTVVPLMTSDDVLMIPVRITIPTSLQMSYNVKFTANTDIVIDTITKQLDVAKHVQLFQTPKVPPIVSIRRSGTTTRVTLMIKQRDAVATSVAIYSRTIFKDTQLRESYVILGTYDASPYAKVEFDAPVNSIVLYRVVPVGPTGILGSEYTNVVVRPSKFTPFRSVALVAKNEDAGVRLECSSLPHNASAIEFVSRNVSIHESKFSNVGGDIIVIDDSTRRADHMTMLDTSVVTGNIYEYAVRIIYMQGNVEVAGRVVVDFTQPVLGKVDTVVSDVSVQHDIGVPNVTFSISTTTLSNQTDTVRTLMINQGIYELFRDDVAKERTAIQDLVAYNVRRVDTVTGEVGDFGTIIDGKFSDVGLGKNNAVQPLSLGRSYRYDITTQLRVPETMLNELKITRTDVVTHKQYAFSPAKFLHPITLSQGTITSPTGLAFRHAKDPMAYGTIGSVVSIDVSFDDSDPHIVAQVAERLDREFVLLTWHVQGSLEGIDCFIIIKVIDNVRTLIGKTHAFSATCQFLHRLSRHDVGELTYVIVPVFNTYKTGVVSTTNTVQVTDTAQVLK
jgi:hypothetical protein